MEGIRCALLDIAQITMAVCLMDIQPHMAKIAPKATECWVKISFTSLLHLWILPVSAVTAIAELETLKFIYKEQRMILITTIFLLSYVEYWYCTWKLSSVHIVSKQPGRTPTSLITVDLGKDSKIFLESVTIFAHHPPPPPPLPSPSSLQQVSRFFKEPSFIWDSVTNLIVNDKLENTRSMSFLRHQLSEKRAPSKACVCK